MSPAQVEKIYYETMLAEYKRHLVEYHKPIIQRQCMDAGWRSVVEAITEEVTRTIDADWALKILDKRGDAI